MSAEKKRKNLSIEDRAAALDAIEKLNKGGEVKLGGQQIKYYKNIAEHFGVTKSKISKLKSKPEEAKQDIYATAAEQKETGSKGTPILFLLILPLRLLSLLPPLHLLLWMMKPKKPSEHLPEESTVW